FSQKNDLRFGLEFTNGLSFINSDNKSILNNKVGYGFNYGLVIDYYFGRNFGISTGVQLSHLRASRTNSPYMDAIVLDSTRTYAFDNNLQIGQKEIYKLTYLDVPITFKLRT